MKLLNLLSWSVCLLAGVVAASIPAEAKMTRNVFPSADNGGPRYLGFIEYLPPDFNRDPDRKFPVVIFLHGAYGGMNNTPKFGNAADLATVVEPHSLPKRLKDGKLDIEAIVIAPASPWFWEQGGRMEQVHDILNWVNNDASSVARNKCDLNRLYVTGLSMGGQGAISFLHDYFDEVAAAAPICAVDAVDATIAGKIAATNKPIWSFHARNDNAQNYAGITHGNIARAWKPAVAAGYNATDNYPVQPGSNPPTGYGDDPVTSYLDNASGLYSWTQPIPDKSLNYKVPTIKKQLFTIYPNQGHGIWDYVYNSQHFYDWLLGQSLAPFPKAVVGKGGLITGAPPAPSRKVGQ